MLVSNSPYAPFAQGAKGFARFDVKPRRRTHRVPEPI
jgi:hypothetical protein